MTQITSISKNKYCYSPDYWIIDYEMFSSDMCLVIISANTMANVRVNIRDRETLFILIQVQLIGKTSSIIRSPTLGIILHIW